MFIRRSVLIGMELEMRSRRRWEGQNSGVGVYMFDISLL
jgi:hypothetical protein